MRQRINIERRRETWHGTVAGIADFGLEGRRGGWRKRRLVDEGSMEEAIKMRADDTQPPLNHHASCNSSDWHTSSSTPADPSVDLALALSEVDSGFLCFEKLDIDAMSFKRGGTRAFFSRSRWLFCVFGRLCWAPMVSGVA